MEVFFSATLISKPAQQHKLLEDLPREYRLASRVAASDSIGNLLVGFLAAQSAHDFIAEIEGEQMFRAALCVGWGLVLFCGNAFAALVVGKEPPDRLGRDAAGNEIRVSDHRGQVVIVSFFASWCGPCRRELPALDAVQRKVKDEIFVVAVNYKEDRRLFRALVERLKDFSLTFTSDESGSIGARYDVAAIPRLVIIGRDGKVAAAHVGYGEGKVPVLVDEINRELLRAAPDPIPELIPMAVSTKSGIEEVATKPTHNER